MKLFLLFSCREARIFAVTTTTSVSSFSTQTLCYSISDATKPLSACAAKRKRRSNKNPIGFEIRKSNDEEIFIAPSLADVDHKSEDSEMILDSSQEDAMVRNGKFISYWITTTLTSTSTVYTGTGTIGGIQCTPNGFTEAQCPGNGRWGIKKDVFIYVVIVLLIFNDFLINTCLIVNFHSQLIINNLQSTKVRKDR